MDASRALPVFGLFLFLLPLLWSDDGTTGGQVPSFAAQAVFVFAVWFVLVAVAGFLASLLPGEAPKRDPDDRDLP
ncbi:MAG: hypothetical protein AAGH83_05095 [Pseudomonadota bacterium]